MTKLNVVKVATPRVRGRYGWCYVDSDGSLVSSRWTYSDESLARQNGELHLKLKEKGNV